MSAQTTTIPTRPMRSDARRNRVRILDAARELFASGGHEVQIEDVARRAGVGVGTVYRHFPDKEALMGELVRERFGIFNERLRAALADEQGEPLELLAGALRASAASLAEDAATRFSFMAGGERVFGHAEREREEFMRLATALVKRARKSGLLRPDFRAADIPVIMCGVCATIDMHGPGRGWQRHLELILRGMKADESGV